MTVAVFGKGRQSPPLPAGTAASATSDQEHPESSERSSMLPALVYRVASSVFAESRTMDSQNWKA